jgi:ppGpp synthetase/RelA/SpoT-type nucleotidyltranferase
MEEYGLDFHCSALLDQYRKNLDLYNKLSNVVNDKLREHIRLSGIELNAIEVRVKAEKSLVGKLERKGSKYQSINNITDIVGARIIAFYNEDVDRIASIAEKLFVIDWDNSVDKRKMHQVNSFGYNSLHYICRLSRDFYFDREHPELNTIPFELQMRTALQHVWSAIQHDIGYKSDIEAPDEYHRNLSRLAGLLELADNEFSRIRTAIADYRRHASVLVKKGKLEEVMLDGDTFKSYLELSPFSKLNQKIAAITAAELNETSFMPYLAVLKSLGMHTLSDVEQLVKTYEDDAYQLALYQLGSTDIDILSSTIGLQNLCIVYILRSGGGRQDVCNMFEHINGKSPNNELIADIIMEQATRLPFMAKGNKNEV